jgi:hypothetical protein
LNPLVIRGRGRLRGALGEVVRLTTTRREPSAFEIPSSSAPPTTTVNRPIVERLFIVNSGLTSVTNDDSSVESRCNDRPNSGLR